MDVEPRTFLLASRGYAGVRPTRHVFVRDEPVSPAAMVGPRSTPGIAQIYRCEETGAERRFGLR